MKILQMDLGSVHNLPEWVNRDRRRLTPKIKRGPPFKKSAFPMYTLYCSIHTQNSTVFVYLLTPWGKTIGPEVLYESIVHSSSG